MRVFTFKSPSALTVIPYSEEAFAAAHEEATKNKELYGFDCEVSEPFDDGQPEPMVEESTDDVLNALLGVMV